jgi:hypothetical protein
VQLKRPEEVGVFDSFLFRVELDAELGTDIFGRSDQHHLGTLVIEQSRVDDGDEATVAEVLHQLGRVLGPLARPQSRRRGGVGTRIANGDDVAPLRPDAEDVLRPAGFTGKLKHIGQVGVVVVFHDGVAAFAHGTSVELDVLPKLVGTFGDLDDERPVALVFPGLGKALASHDDSPVQRSVVRF